MATDMAHNTAFDGLPPGAPRPRLRGLWQVPAFVAGLLALVFVWVFRPIGTDRSARQLERDVVEARRALDKLPPDTDRAEHLMEEVLQGPSTVPDRMGEVHFLLGTAYLFQGDSFPRKTPVQSGKTRGRTWRRRSRWEFRPKSRTGSPIALPRLGTRPGAIRAESLIT